MAHFDLTLVSGDATRDLGHITQNAGRQWTDNGATDIAHNAVACLIDDADACSVVELIHTGAGDVLSTPVADGEGAERAEALLSHSSAGDAAYAAPAAGKWLSEPHRGTPDDRALQPGAGTRSAFNIPTSAHKSHTHLFATNEPR